jgi:glycosyltransferase involved in cell wall biosynthesis
MRVAIVFASRFPSQAAAAKRLELFRRGLGQIGVDCEIVALEQDCAQRADATCLARNLGVFSRLSAFSKALAAQLAKRHSKAPIHTVLFYNDMSWVHHRSLQFCKAHQIATLADCTEWHRARARLLSKAHFWDQLLFRRGFLCSMDAIVGISGFWESIARRAHKPFLRIPAMADPISEPARPVPPLTSGDEFHLVYVGIFAPRERPEMLLQAVKSARNRGLRLKLTVVGDVTRHPYGARIVSRTTQDSDLIQGVRFVGRISAARLSESFDAAHAFVLLWDSSKESRACFATRIPEYLLTGKPTILSLTPDLSEYLVHGTSAWLIPHDKCQTSLIEAFQHLSQDPNRAREIGLAGRQAAMRVFDYRHHAERLRNFMITCLAE